MRGPSFRTYTRVIVSPADLFYISHRPAIEKTSKGRLIPGCRMLKLSVSSLVGSQDSGRVECAFKTGLIDATRPVMGSIRKELASLENPSIW